MEVNYVNTAKYPRSHHKRARELKAPTAVASRRELLGIYFVFWETFNSPLCDLSGSVVILGDFLSLILGKYVGLFARMYENLLGMYVSL